VSQVIRREDVIKVLEDIASTIEKNKDYLTELDSAIGDGDHGINLNRGFTEVRRKLDELKENEDIGAILKIVGSTLISSVGGSVGFLYGTAFTRAGKAVENKRQIDIKDLAKLFDAAEKGIMDVGGARLGDKTMLDAIHPAVEALKEAANKNLTLIEALEKSVKAAEHGVKRTVEMTAKKGRSMYLGERSRGHQDVGATSFYLIIRSSLETLKGKYQHLGKVQLHS